jgi:DNA-binding LytR/AlgR family response regulator
MRMIRIAVAEDDPRYTEQLCRYIEAYGKESGHTFSVTTYPDGDILVEEYRSQFDIVFLDVDMPIMDGLTAAEQIRRMDQKVILIFLTNMAQHAIRGYAVDAMDYVLKGVSYDGFSQRLGRAVQRLDKRDRTYLTVPIKGGMMKVDAEDIYYVESQGHQLVFHTRGGEIQSNGTMRSMEETLGPLNFYRCNNGYLVNLGHVDGVQNGCALVRGEQLLISRPRRAAFLEALTDYVGGLNG